MVARVATFEGGSNEELRRLNEERIGSGTMGFPEGMRRALVLGDGDAGRMLISFFDDRDAVAAAEERFEAMGDEFPEEVRGRRTSVRVYDVLFEQEL
jgi:hypothetical protein